jgi:choline dehydrogenase
MSVEFDQEYDVVVIGAGTSGCIVAARLSEDPARRVLLLEAGPDFEGGKPEPLRDARAAVVQGYHWPFNASVHAAGAASLGQEMKRAAGVFAAASGRLNMMRATMGALLSGGNPVSRFPYPMARVLGGGSSVNGAMAMVPPPEDFDGWARLGNPDWNWAQVAPWFARLLGDEGAPPIVPIEPTRSETFTPIQRAFHAACLELGHPEADLADPGAIGVGGVPCNVRDGVRMSADELYLRTALARDNLELRSDAMVERILLEDDAETGLRAGGVQVRIGGQRSRIRAQRIVLCAGTINSPALLQRSGIGPRDALEAAGVPVRLHAPAVGANLVDHPAIVLWAVPRAGAYSSGEPFHQVVLRAGDDGLQVLMLGATRTELFPPLREVSGSDVAIGLSAVLGRPRSRGRVRIISPDPESSPSIELNLLAHPEDMAQAMTGARLVWRIAGRPSLRDRIERVVMWNDAIVGDERQLETLVYTTVRSSMHPVGTLRMGGDDDPMAATDGFGSFRGVARLTVADASIMPAITTVPTNLACMAIAERIAFRLRT